MNRKYSIWSVIAAGLLSVLVCTVVQACGDEANSTVMVTENTRFELIDSYEGTSSKLRVYVDADTGVQYLVVNRVGRQGISVAVMVDADGKPLVKGEENDA